jgi:PD-(D/E)XK nuclease superfamily
MTDFIPATDPPPSPFLPGTKIQYAWDSTSLGYLKTCPRLYQYTMIDGYTSKEESVHLRFGGEYHQALHDYDLSRAEGIPHNDAVFDVIRELLIRTFDYAPDSDTKAGKYKSREALIRTVIWYLDACRQNDNFSTYIMANGKPAVELSFRFELAFSPERGEFTDSNQKQPYLLCGHLDRVCDDGDGNLYVEDHKTTTTTLSDYFFNQFEPSNQMSLYSFGGQMVLEAPIRGVIINGVQLMVDSSRFVRGFTFRTKDQLEEWVTDLSRWLALAEWYAESGYWPQNDTACDKFGGCRFRKVCSKSPSVREIFLKSDFNKLDEKDRWNPLVPRG